MLKLLLNNNGVKLQAHNFPYHFQPFHLYSTTPTQQINPAFATYLVSSLGFSKQHSLSTSARLSKYWQSQGGKTNVSDFNFAANAASVIGFFKQHGFDDAHIRKVVSLCPPVLTADVDRILKPKFKCLQDMGLSGSHLVSIFANNPRSLGNNSLVPNVVLLENCYGISIDRIRKRFVQHPRPYLQETGVFKDMLIRVEEKLGISRDEAMFLYGMELLTVCSEEVIESKCEVFRSFGWTEADVAALIRQNPICLASSEARLRKYLDFLMNELGCEAAYLASHCPLLTYSLEKRLLPRYRVLLVLKEKGLIRMNYPLFSAVCVPESRFFQKFVQPFKEVHEVYVPVKLNSGVTR